MQLFLLIWQLNPDAELNKGKGSRCFTEFRREEIFYIFNRLLLFSVSNTRCILNLKLIFAFQILIFYT